ncbi:lipoprotein [Paenibacillus agaridevorans]|uniref:Lipoprotein n=1 Tax=Paenibacillus agaridevorans TaxID=171404 RepID=A0A2R5EWL7_9BACL|nr:ABC transporter substrate-binding protein [Paenibacillus agaridevorans]GBG11050.1 lipoprotein [Paenibacillus agaridevorans]
MKNKVKLGAMLLLSLSIVLSGCKLTTKNDVAESPSPTTGSEVVDNNKVDIEVLGMSANEADLNIVRDQLNKNGFNVKLNVQADYSSFKAQQDAGNYDVSLSGWTTVTGNPDYAVRSLFKTGGDYSIMSDADIDALIEQAAAQTPEQFVATYKDFEQKLVFDNAYIAPLYSSLKSQALNKDVLNPDSVRLSKSRSLPWEELDFNDTAKRDKDALVLQSTMPTLTSLDPIKGNDGSINIINTNQYVRLVNLTDDDKVTSVGSLSLNHAIADGNSDYYFILRDDINFAAVKDKLAVDTGERVGADDVIFSLDRAKNKDSVPDHRTYTLHEHIKSAEVVTDVAALEGIKVSGSDQTIKAALEEGLDAKITSLVSDKTQSDNGAGKYQVVKVTTTEPFPQVLNYLAHQSAGIVSKKQVEAINTYDVAKFDPNKDIPYGDQNTVTEGNAYNNTLYTSGPYILSYKNDYEAIFYKNPAYMTGTDHAPKINSIKVRFIKDADSTLAALRSGEIHLYYAVSETKFDIVKGDSKLQLQTLPSNAVSYLLFNTKNRAVAESADLRKAVLYSINQEDFITYYGGNKFKAISTLSPIVDTGLELKADAAKAKEFLNAYKASK